MWCASSWSAIRCSSGGDRPRAEPENALPPPGVIMQMRAAQAQAQAQAQAATATPAR
jgi:hypothetical protein